MKYRLIDGLGAFEILGDYLVVYSGGDKDVRYLQVINDAAFFYFNLLKEWKSVDELVLKACEITDAPYESVEAGVVGLLEVFNQNNYLECDT